MAASTGPAVGGGGGGTHNDGQDPGVGVNTTTTVPAAAPVVNVSKDHGHDGATGGGGSDDEVRLWRRRTRSSVSGSRPFSARSGSADGHQQQQQLTGHDDNNSEGFLGAASALGMVPLFLLVAVVSLSWSLYQLPLTRVVERRLCAEYFAGGEGDGDGYTAVVAGAEIPEEMCKKVDEVQKGLGRIMGAMETGWVVGDFVMTIPMIAVADRYGHGVVLLLNLVPRAVLLGWTFAVGYFDGVLPVGAIMAAPVLSVLGGDCVFASIVYSLVSSSTDDLLKRASFFGQVNAITAIFTYQLGPALASASMSVLLWLPLWIGIALLLVAARVISLLKSGPLLTRSQPRPRPRQQDCDDDHEEGAPLLSEPITHARRHRPSAMSEVPRSIKTRFHAIINMITTYPLNFTLLLLGFFLTSLASSDTKLLAQYISKRYEWKFTSVGYLLSAKAVFNFFLLFYIIPAQLRWKRKPSDGPPTDHERRADDRSTLAWAQICLFFSVLGALAIGLSVSIWFLVPSLLLYALGIALPMFTYSLLRSPGMHPPPRLPLTLGADDRPDDDGVAETQMPTTGARGSAPASDAQLFSIVMLVKTSGALVGAPLMAGLWVHGVGVGEDGLGLPYFVSAACYGLVMYVFSKIRF